MSIVAQHRPIYGIQLGYLEDTCSTCLSLTIHYSFIPNSPPHIKVHNSQHSGSSQLLRLMNYLQDLEFNSKMSRLETLPKLVQLASTLKQ